MGRSLPLFLPALTLATACAGSYESQVESDYAELRDRRGEAADGEARVELDGSLQGYVQYAMLRSPELEASWERYRAAVLSIAPRRRLPEPMITYAYFVRSVETRVGPQRHRLSIRQSFPWPTRLTSGADAQAQMARAQQQRFEAQALALTWKVATAYWQLWLVHRSHQIMLEQEDVYETLEGSVGARVEVGNADLADLGQVQLRLERMRDHHGLHRQAIREKSARLLALIGAPQGTSTPITDTPPEVALPAADDDALYADAMDHPRIDSYEYMAEAAEERADAEDAAGLPMFTLGLDWIETGEAMAPGVQDSGKDPVIVSLGMTLPIWFGSYGDASDAARAEAMAFRAEGEGAEQAAAAELTEALTQIADTHRRVILYEGTLLPQGETVLGSTLGSYQTGRAGLADILLAVRELLEIQLERERALAEHAIAWAHLEHIVGHPVERRQATPEEIPHDHH